jgi:hypothetical protein
MLSGCKGRGLFTGITVLWVAAVGLGARVVLNYENLPGNRVTHLTSGLRPAGVLAPQQVSRLSC